MTTRPRTDPFAVRRQKIAARVLQGLLAGRSRDERGYTPRTAAKAAVEYADELIARLSEPREEPVSE